MINLINLAQILPQQPPTYTNVQSIADFIKSTAGNIINWSLGIAGALAILFIIIGAFRMVTSAGDQEQYELGKKTVTYAIIGIVVIALSLLIVNTLITIIPKRK